MSNVIYYILYIFPLLVLVNAVEMPFFKCL